MRRVPEPAPDAPLVDEPLVQADAGVDAAPVPKVSFSDACRNRRIARTNIPSSSGFDAVACSGVDLDGKPPCEAECSLERDTTKNPTSMEPMTMVTVHIAYFTMASRPPKEIGRFKTYDGPVDAGLLGVQAEIFVDYSTSPPTLELLPPTCSHRSRPSPTSAQRAACQPSARYQYDGNKLRLAR